MDALGSVLKSLNEQEKSKKIKNLDPSLARLRELDRKGLLEPYILLARPDRGIAQDYVEYKKNNKEKLRRYMTEVMLAGGGN
jgi:hypothetical protein